MAGSKIYVYGLHCFQKKKKVKSLNRVWLFATPWTVAYQVPPSMGFSRQEYWSGLPVPSPIAFRTLQHEQHELLCNYVCMSLCCVTSKEEGNLWPQATTLGKGRTGCKLRSLLPKPQVERPELCGVAGDLPGFPEAGSSPVGETRWGALGDHTMEAFLSLCSPSANCPYSFFFPTQNIKSLPQMEMLFPRLTICLDHCQVKSCCLSSRDAVTIIAGSLICHTHLVKKVGLKWSRGCKDTYRKLKRRTWANTLLITYLSCDLLSSTYGPSIPCHARL